MTAARGCSPGTEGPWRGFTLVELLVVISVITILAALVLPMTMRSSALSRITNCKSNLRQIHFGLLNYSAQKSQFFPGWWRGFDASGNPQVRSDDHGDDDLSALYIRGYVPDLGVFNCPSTTDRAMDRRDENGVDRPLGYDIFHKATENHINNGPPGQLSYEYCGEVQPGLQYGEISPRKAWLAYDIDDRKGEDYVVDGDNHGTSGGNILFLDGSVSWQRASGWAKVIWDGHNKRLIKQPAEGVAGEWDKVADWPKFH